MSRKKVRSCRKSLAFDGSWMLLRQVALCGNLGSNLSTVQLRKWEVLCMANEPEGEPSELRRTTCKVNACRICSSPCSCRHVPLAHAPCAQPMVAIHKHRLLSLGIGQASRLKRSCSKPRRVLDGRHTQNLVDVMANSLNV